MEPGRLVTLDDLGLIHTDMLVEELLRRGDHVVVGLLRVGDGGPEAQVRIRRWIGNPETVAGLAQGLAIEALVEGRSREGEP